MDGRVSALSDFEYRVWRQYIHAADDFGVLPASAQSIQAGNHALTNRPVRKVKTALDTLIRIGLLATFECEGVLYVWNRKWQDYQGIAWPRRTTRPAPPDLTEASQATRELFAKHGKSPKTLKSSQSSEKTSDQFEVAPRAHDARARNPNPDTNPDVVEDLVPEEPEISTDGLPPVFRKPEPRHVGLINGAEQRRHQQHGWCAPREGLCVLDFLHREFLGKSRRSEAELKRWYLSVVQAYEGREIGEDALVFWRNEFAQWIGNASSRPSSSRTGDTMTAAKESLRHRLGRIATEEGDAHERRKIES